MPMPKPRRRHPTDGPDDRPQVPVPPAPTVQTLLVAQMEALATQVAQLIARVDRLYEYLPGALTNRQH